MGKKWFPLESNPEVMNTYVQSLGLAAPRVMFSDVFGLEEDLLSFVPQPVKAVLLVYPITDKTEAYGNACVEAMGDASQANGQLYYMKQTISNACGTVGILHALANNIDCLGPITPGSFLEQFLAATKDMTPEQRAQFLEKDETLDAAQATAAQSGQSTLQPIDTDINLHFVCFVCKEGQLYELDGRKAMALCRGPCQEEDLLRCAAAAIKEYMEVDPGQTNYGITAMSCS